MIRQGKHSIQQVILDHQETNIDLETDPAKAIDKLNNKELILEVFDAREIVYDSKIIFSKASLNYISWDIIKKEDIIKRMTINFNKDIFKINYNIEKRDVESDRSKINEMNEILPALNSNFEKIIGEIFQ